MSPKIWSIIFFLILTLSEEIWGYGLISKKTEALHTELNERAEAATNSYSATGDFYNIFIVCLWLRIIRRSDQDA